MEIIYSPEKLINKKKSSIFVFLGGPIQGTTDWRENLPEIPGVTYINPRRRDLTDFNWDAQVEWETLGLRVSDIVLFWIPPMTDPDPSRDYAQTTRMELLENLAREKTIVLGISPGIHASRYIEYKYTYYTGKKAHSTLEACIEEIKELCKPKERQVFFTSDTHFSSDRALELSKRPFRDVLDMDLSMIERWNKVVKPWDVVYHLGDFGDFKWLQYLNGKIRFLPGNYEKDITTFPDDFEISYQYHEPVLYNSWLLGHEPSFVNSLESIDHDFCLFGHIHGRQKIKKFGLDVGVDANNFTPVSEEEVKFYKTAIEKYYDNEVFI
jgi:calcineurin-like phosphoesterase family protein